MSSSTMSAAFHEPTTVEDAFVRYPAEARARYRAVGAWSGRTLASDLVDAASRHPSATALITPESTWTYADLLAAATAFAHGLLRRTDLRPGDAMMFQSGNVAETPIAYFGCLLAGVRPVCTLPQHGVREVGLLARHIGARGLLVQADFGRGQLVDNARALLHDGQITEIVVARGTAPDVGVGLDAVLAEGAGAAIEDLPFEHLPLDQVAVFQLSGGTTGLPKVAPRLHEEYAYNARIWAEAMGWGPGTVLLYTLPVMHNAGIQLALQPALLSGATLVLAPSADIDGMLDLIDQHHPVSIPLIMPAIAIRLLESDRAHGFDFSGVRDVIVGGQRLAVEIAENLRDELGIRVRQMFGMAEGMFFLTPADASEACRHLTVGAPISAEDEVRVVIPGTDVEVQEGEVGELVARGPYTIRGYYRADQHDASSFTRDGYYRTGDLSRRHLIDGRAYYSIDGRIKDVINRGAEKIHAEEVEELILRHPEVANAAVVAMPDPLLGERACAYLVMEDDADPLTVATLGGFLQTQGLAKYKLPERVEIVAEFPMSNVSKVSKKDLRDDIAAKIAAEHA